MSNSVKADSWKPRFSIAKTESGGPPVIEYLTVADGETILEGDPIVLSSGEAAEGAATSGQLYGIAASNGDAGDSIPVWVGNTDNIFIGQADAKTEDIAPGSTCDIVGSGTNWLLDIGASTEDVVIIVDHVPGDADDDSTDCGRLYFKIVRSQYLGYLAAQ